MQIQDHKIIIRDVEIYYQTAGDTSKPAILFMHGWGARKNNICGKGKERVILELTQYFYVVALELPGLVRSAPPPEAWNAEEYARFVHAFLASLNLRPAFIMGQSFGGGIASTYASLYPEYTPRLILVDASQKVNNYKRRWTPSSLHSHHSSSERDSGMGKIWGSELMASNTGHIRANEAYML